jgi:hypothetical protein
MKGRTGLNIAAGFIKPMLCVAVEKLPEGKLGSRKESDIDELDNLVLNSV